MPMHDWTRVGPGIYHHFHVPWTVTILDRLNAGLLPRGYFAMVAQMVGQPDRGVIAAQPETVAERYANKANRIEIHHGLGEIVAVIALASPGNKEQSRSLERFGNQAIHLLDQRVNLLIIDPFPPGKHDPHSIQKAIWDDFTDLPPDKPLTVVAYQAGPVRNAFIELFAVGDRLPDMPLFLFNDHYVLVPLEETYQTTWNVLPAELRELLEPPSS